MALLGIMLGVENEKKKNYAMVKLVTPKRVALPNGRTFIAQYKTIKRSELPPHIVMKRTYTQRAAPRSRRRRRKRKQQGQGIFCFIKKAAKNPLVGQLQRKVLHMLRASIITLQNE